MADLQAIAGDIVALSEGDILEVNPECTATFDERLYALCYKAGGTQDQVVLVGS